MTIVIFSGPTLSAEEGRKELDAIFLPPAAQGDVYHAALEKPQAIGIVDGYFEGIASVAHKEVLWAMSQGIYVYGSASMGALRAAELSAFGMQGVGAIFEALQSAEIEDDDEVAVAHAGAEHGFRALSDALVNIRATLRRALELKIIGHRGHELLLQSAKSLFYPERLYPVVAENALRAGLDAEEGRRFLEFARREPIHQKRQDALAMLRLIRERHVDQRAEPKQVRFYFAHTDAWEATKKRAALTRQARVGNTSDLGVNSLQSLLK